MRAEEYKGVGEFLAFLSTSDVQAAWHQNTGYLPITAAAGEARPELQRVSMKPTRAPTSQ